MRCRRAASGTPWGWWLRVDGVASPVERALHMLDDFGDLGRLEHALSDGGNRIVCLVNDLVVLEELLVPPTASSVFRTGHVRPQCTPTGTRSAHG